MSDGYPAAWDEIKDYVREQAGHRCVRCGHPYRKGEHGNGEWSPCDRRCTHEGPIRYRFEVMEPWLLDGLIASYGWTDVPGYAPTRERLEGATVEARWRILTVHHLDGDKANCRWWNLASLDQRCHLTIQGRVKMERAFILEHSPWFRPFAAGWYAWKYEGREITREEAAEREDELLAYERLA